jgi:hypothetical protein
MEENLGKWIASAMGGRPRKEKEGGVLGPDCFRMNGRARNPQGAK